MANIYVDVLVNVAKAIDENNLSKYVFMVDSTGYSGDGSAATSASLGGPGGVTVDNSGNLYIADSGNGRIRKVSAATGVITTVAGNGMGGYSGVGVSLGFGFPLTGRRNDYPSQITVDMTPLQ